MPHTNRKSNNHSFWLVLLMLGAILLTYLFVSAPPPLPDGPVKPIGRQISSYQLFEWVQQENAVIRKLWTQEIVGQGKKQGFKFSEDWEEEDIEAGPLPALLLRATASLLEKNPVPLSLFLGSDAPINKANKFDPIQNEKFKMIKEDGKPRFFYSTDIERYTGMFPDIASVDPCVKCHNEHKDTPKKDWKLWDVMGATTWLYPEESLSVDEALSIISVLREQFRAVYESYLKEAEAFSSPPEISDKWPREGYYLPKTDEFMRVFEEKASQKTLQSIFEVVNREP